MKTTFASLFAIALLTGCASGPKKHQHIVPDAAMSPEGFRFEAQAIVSDDEFQKVAQVDIQRQRDEFVERLTHPQPQPSSTIVAEPEPTLRDVMAAIADLNARMDQQQAWQNEAGDDLVVVDQKLDLMLKGWNKRGYALQNPIYADPRRSSSTAQPSMNPAH